MPCLRPCAVAMSSVGAEVPTPNSAAWPTAWKTAAVSSSSLAGMQPTCRHVPPSLERSTRPTSSPALAAYSAEA